MKIKNTNKFNNLYLTMYYLKLSMKNKCCFVTAHGAFGPRRNGGNHVRVLQRHNDRVLHYTDRLDRRSIRCHLLPHACYKKTLVTILLPLSLLLLCLPLSIQRPVQQFGSCHVLALHTALDAILLPPLRAARDPATGPVTAPSVPKSRTGGYGRATLARATFAHFESGVDQYRANT